MHATKPPGRPLSTRYDVCISSDADVHLQISRWEVSCPKKGRDRGGSRPHFRVGLCWDKDQVNSTAAVFLHHDTQDDVDPHDTQDDVGDVGAAMSSLVRKTLAFCAGIGALVHVVSASPCEARRRLTFELSKRRRPPVNVVTRVGGE